MGLRPVWVRFTLITILGSATASCDPAKFEGYCLGADGGCTEAGAGQTGGWGGYAGSGGQGQGGGWGGAAGWGGGAGWGGSAGYSGTPGQCPGACSATCQDCDSDGVCETMVTNHPYHCGRCNRTCTASSCQEGGRCVAEVIAEDTGGYGHTELAAGGGYVYYAVGKWIPDAWAVFTIKRIPASMAYAPEVVADNIASRSGTLSLVANDGAVYWATREAGVMMAGHTQPQYPTSLAPAGNQPWIDGPIRVATSVGGETCIVRVVSTGVMSLTGTKAGSTTISTSLSPEGVLGLAADSYGNCYVGLRDSPAQLKVLKAGSFDTITTGPVHQIAFPPGQALPVYFIRSGNEGQNLYSWSGFSEVLLDAAIPGALAAYGQYVYYADPSGTQVRSNSGQPQTAITLADEVGGIGAIQVDGTYVYWTTNTSPGNANGVIRVHRTSR